MYNTRTESMARTLQPAGHEDELPLPVNPTGSKHGANVWEWLDNASRVPPDAVGTRWGTLHKSAEQFLSQNEMNFTDLEAAVMANFNHPAHALGAILLDCHYLKYPEQTVTWKTSFPQPPKDIFDNYYCPPGGIGLIVQAPLGSCSFRDVHTIVNDNQLGSKELDVGEKILINRAQCAPVISKGLVINTWSGRTSLICMYAGVLIHQEVAVSVEVAGVVPLIVNMGPGTMAIRSCKEKGYRQQKARVIRDVIACTPVEIDYTYVHAAHVWRPSARAQQELEKLLPKFSAPAMECIDYITTIRARGKPPVEYIAKIVRSILKKYGAPEESHAC